MQASPWARRPCPGPEPRDQPRLQGGTRHRRAARVPALVVLWLTGVIELAGKVALAALVVSVALILISAPFWRAMVSRLGAERVARARSDERAEVAAHLHDSVLQTLALMQRRADDPRAGREARPQAGEGAARVAPGRPAAQAGERLADALKTLPPRSRIARRPGRGRGRRRRATRRAARGSRRSDAGGAHQLGEVRLRRAGRSGSTPRSRRGRPRCSSTTAAPASTRRRSPRTGAVSASR